MTPGMVRPLTALGIVVRRAFDDQRRSILTWGLTLGAFGAFMAAIYPSVQDTITQVAKNYPSALAKAFDVNSMNTVEGYVNAEMFSIIVPMAIGLFAARSILHPLVMAEEQGQLDTILSLPLSRRVLVAGAFLVTALLSAAILGLGGVMIVVAGRLAGTGIDIGLVAAGVFGLWPLAIFFAGVSALAGGVLHRSASVTGVAVGVLVGMYILDLAGRLATALEPLRSISVFKYYGSPMLDGIDVWAFVGVSAAAVVLVVAGALLLERRDIRH